MDQKLLSLLEFDRVLRMLADQTTFSGGRDLAVSLAPSASFGEVSRWQEETAEAARLVEERGEPPFGGMRDVRLHVKRAQRGAALRPEELLEVADALRASVSLRTFLEANCPGVNAETLRDLAQILGAFPSIEKEINRSIGSDGEVLDQASPQLARLRSRLRTLRQRVRDHLDRLIRSDKGHRFLQEPIVTLRNGRFVVPVKQESRGEIAGVVHDQSGSGATVFVEPMVVVETNNEIRRVEAEEAEEIERILLEISQMVAEDGERIVQSVEIAAELDFIFAKAKLALKWDATQPSINREGRVDLRRARHPLLSGTVVPIDVRLGSDFTALVITGPNTGGKTVTLKTLGLFALMAQAGLHLPCDVGSEMPVFRSVYADIGDEQSIEQNLSTFSGHMTNIVRILERADEGSLVLLDELGAGTDPTEGAALAVALLEAFVAAGCRVVATTHFSELKSLAYTHPSIENGSVEFDPATLRPTYKLLIGHAGQSNAFAIARRLGLPERVVRRAQGHLSEERKAVDELLSSVEASRRQAERDREEAAALRRGYLELRDRYREAFERVKEARRDILEEARREAQTLLEQTRRDVDALVGQLRQAGRADFESEAAQARAQLARMTEAVKTDRNAQASDPARTRKRDDGARIAQVAAGMTVGVKGIAQQGEVVQVLGDGKVQVQVGAVKVTVGIEELEKATQAGRPGAPARADFTGLQRRKAVEVASEVDLRGMVVDEALEEVDKYIDDALLAGLEKVRVIHGKGTGALREAVHAFVQSHPRIRGYRLGEVGEGGSGVTVIEL